MRRTVAVCLLACLALAGCSNSGSSADAKPSPRKTVSKEAAFLKAVHTANLRSWTDKGPTDDELLEYPQQWCDGLAAGHSVKWLFTMFGDGGGLYPIGEHWGTYKADANAVLVMGVRAYCPENLADVKEQLRASGDY
ncbi:DUF732 domain-containing protein [Streptomyces sp. NPDC051987]|uniref:DUF732 domain-containing protein n=1 Tax=Streptomyces sp. NPDC051987 TaxID=3155808 RepID=UPI00342FE1C7